MARAACAWSPWRLAKGIARAVVLSMIAASGGCSKSSDRTVLVQPLGTIDERSLAAVKTAIEAKLSFKVKVAKPVPLPPAAYYASRNRHKADRLLDYLASECGHDFVLGVTSVDISFKSPPHENWGVFGLATIDGKSCVVSSYRLRKPGKKSMTQRIAQVAVHEAGHMFGLDHCPTPRCVMNDAKGTIKSVDDSTGEFYQRCRHLI